MFISLTGDGKNPKEWVALESTTPVRNMTVNYPTNSYESNDQEAQAINDAAYYLYYMPEVSITIVGNTSRSGSEESNLKLSQQRADNMKLKILDAARGLGATAEELQDIERRINAIGRGEEAAKNRGAEDGSDEARDRNTKVIYKIE